MDLTHWLSVDLSDDDEGAMGDKANSPKRLKKGFKDLKKSAKAERIRPLMDMVKKWADENDLGVLETLCELGHMYYSLPFKL